MKENHITFMLMLGCMALMMPFAHADDKDASWGQKNDTKVQEIYSQLNLTDQQEKQLEENKTKHRGEMKDTFTKIKADKEALKAELMKPELDMNKINEIQSQIKALQADTLDRRLNSVLEVRKILTPEQFGKFIALMDKRKHEHEASAGDDKD